MFLIDVVGSVVVGLCVFVLYGVCVLVLYGWFDNVVSFVLLVVELFGLDLVVIDLFGYGYSVYLFFGM